MNKVANMSAWLACATPLIVACGGDAESSGKYEGTGGFSSASGGTTNAGDGSGGSGASVSDGSGGMTPPDPSPMGLTQGSEPAVHSTSAIGAHALAVDEEHMYLAGLEGALEKINLQDSARSTLRQGDCIESCLGFATAPVAHEGRVAALWPDGLPGLATSGTVMVFDADGTEITHEEVLLDPSEYDSARVGDWAIFHRSCSSFISVNLKTGVVEIASFDGGSGVKPTASMGGQLFCASAVEGAIRQWTPPDGTVTEALAFPSPLSAISGSLDQAGLVGARLDGGTVSTIMMLSLDGAEPSPIAELSLTNIFSILPGAESYYLASASPIGIYKLSQEGMLSPVITDAEGYFGAKPAANSTHIFWLTLDQIWHAKLE